MPRIPKLTRASEGIRGIVLCAGSWHYARMTTQVWLRNPHNYHREIREAGHPYTVWNWATLRQRGVDPVAFSELAFGGMAWETMVVGGQGVTHYRPGDSYTKPSAVYPLWSYADHDLDYLHHLIENPISEVEFDEELGGTVRPVAGQDHRVVISYLPGAHTYEARAFHIKLADLQADHPEVTIHHFGADSYHRQMAINLGSLDYDARNRAFHGEIQLPIGKVRRPIDVEPGFHQYVEMFDYRIDDLDEDPKLRCIYNIRALVWAGEYYTQEINFLVRKPKRIIKKPVGRPRKVRPDIPLHLPERVARKPEWQPQTQSVFIRPVTKRPGDQLSCNHCTLQLSCKSYRDGSVCILPNTPGKKLADMFGVRDADSVIDGLSHLLTMQANRLQSAMQDEEQNADGLNPEVSKEIKATFENGKTLAQLLNPALKGGPKVVGTVNNGPNNTLVVANGNENNLVAGIIRQFEQQGIARADITTEMITQAMSAMNNGKVIEA